MNNNAQHLQGRIDFAMRLINGYLNDDSVTRECKNKLLTIEGALVDKSIFVDDKNDDLGKQIIEERERRNKLITQKINVPDAFITVSDLGSFLGKSARGE